MREPALTAHQPYASAIMVRDEDGDCLKPVENRSWPAPETLAWIRCPCLDRPMCSNVGNPDHDGSPDTCTDCDDTGWQPPRLWIHAGSGIDTSTAAQPTWTALRDAWGLTSYIATHDRVLALTGVLLGPVTLTGCHHADGCRRTRQADPYVDSTRRVVYCSRFAEPDAYHWSLTDPHPLRTPIPMRGHQRLWDLTWHLDPEEVPAHA